MFDQHLFYICLCLAILGFSAGVVGVFAVISKRSLLSDAVSHACLPGVCLSFLIFKERNLFILGVGGLFTSFIGVLLLRVVKVYTKIKDDTAIALIIGCFFGLGVVLLRIIQNLPSGNQAGIDHYIFGKASSIIYQDLYVILIVSAIAMLYVFSFYKELVSICFDSVYSRTICLPTNRLDLSLIFMICLLTIAGLPAVGVIMMVALLIIPATAARFWTSNMKSLIFISGLFGIISTVTGTLISALVPAPLGIKEGWPTGPIIVIVSTIIFFISFLFVRLKHKWI